MQPIIFQNDRLPDKIQSALEKRKVLKGQFLISCKTFLKPNATVPLLWFAVLSDGILLLNTHKTRSVYKEFPTTVLNSVRLRRVSQQESMIDLISTDISEEDFTIPIAGSIDLKIIKESLLKANISVVS